MSDQTQPKDKQQEEANKLRELLQPYLLDVQKHNAKVAKDFADKNFKITQNGGVPSTYYPPFKQPSFNDLMYWVQQSGDYSNETN
jgi:hypothetical protein